MTLSIRHHHTLNELLDRLRLVKLKPLASLSQDVFVYKTAAISMVEIEPVALRPAQFYKKRP